MTVIQTLLSLVVNDFSLPSDASFLLYVLPHKLIQVINRCPDFSQWFSPYSHAWESVWLLPWASAPFSNLCKRKDLRRINSSGPLSYDSS